MEARRAGDGEESSAQQEKEREKEEREKRGALRWHSMVGPFKRVFKILIWPLSFLEI